VAPDVQCETDFIQKDNSSDVTDPAAFAFEPGSIWSFMVTTDGNECKVHYDKDSNGNTVNIWLLFPQYFVITVGEVGTKDIYKKTALLKLQ